MFDYIDGVAHVGVVEGLATMLLFFILTFCLLGGIGAYFLGDESDAPPFFGGIAFVGFILSILTLGAFLIEL